MSWRASGYVKELRQGLTVTEKFVLLILAEYHNTEKKFTWPSVATLADDCLMTKRGVQQILSRLVDKNFIIRSQRGGGRGNISGYQIVGVDVEKGEPQTPNGCASFAATTPHSHAKTPHSHAQNPAQPTYRNKEEPLLNLQEPTEFYVVGRKSKQTSKSTMPTLPTWLPEKSWNEWLSYRTERKKPVMPTTAHKQIAQLTEYRAMGMDPVKVIDQSITRQWEGLFELKDNRGNGYQVPMASGPTALQRLRAQAPLVDRAKEQR